MSGNDHHIDRPRASRSPRDPRVRRPEPVTDPWQSADDAEFRRRGEPGARAHRDEHGVGRRGEGPAPEEADRPRTPAAGLDLGADTERPRGRRRRPGPADTGSMPRIQDDTAAPVADPLQEQPRGRRRRSDTGAEELGAHPGTGPIPTDRRRGPRRRPSYDELAPESDRSSGRGPDPLDDAPPPRRRPRAVADEGTGEQTGAFAAPADSDPVDTPRRVRRGAEPADGRRSRRAEPAEEPVEALVGVPGGDPAPERGSRRSRRERDIDSDPEEGTGSLPLPFDAEEHGEDDEDERPRSRRSRRGDDDDDRGGRRGGGRRKAKGKRKRKGGFASFSAVMVLVVLLGVGGFGGYTLLSTYVIPPDYSGEGNGEVEIVIENGDSGTTIAQKLEEAGVVKSVRAFTNELRGQNANFAPGTYLLRSQMSGAAAVQLLLTPEARVGVRLTIPEGLRAVEILPLIAEETGMEPADLGAAYADEEALDLPDYAENGPEGFLFPDTYQIDPGTTAADLLKQMVDRHKSVAEEIDLVERAEAIGYTPNEVMATAAIIQAETGRVEDMGKISRVVYNRLDINMQLGMDSTCFYVLDEYGTALNDDQLIRCRDSGSDYRTYYRTGLPIGPIVSPGADAIEAALEPEEGEWLFFVATDPSSLVTKFAVTEAEFTQLKEEFEANRLAQAQE
ncbi:endolytic transglycosylase MltG [Nocardiopsis ansamitocini]|uniref:Endolytic murein transglycosylase n=1 Tax=Nocardiopsis ansamitocini TaxID=1670832 RepID=A0A9W6UIW7_9ACTN|nr:endolytic transglycosylase MltG [Nocardiopsis ansamitocini]GLU48122.1 hypothetical protein Nans01_24730 [Nocardiopsis ansamitocini]